jgi:hypothetical protein
VSTSLIWFAASSSAATIPLESLTLSIPSDPVNVLSVEFDAGRLGSDSGQTSLNGTLMAELHVDTSSGFPTPTGITFNGGRVEASDVTFEFLLGIVEIQLSDLAGFPATPLPPGDITDNRFDASQHQLIINEGTIKAIGTTIDLSTDPVLTDGEGRGSITLTQVGPAEGDLFTYDVNVSLPVSGVDTFVVENVPLYGSIDVDVSMAGKVEAKDRFSLSIPAKPILLAGDANQDLSFDQLDLVKVSVAAKFLSGGPATWGEGDWDGAPGGSPGNPPQGDGVFDQFDIIAAQQAGVYLTGSYAGYTPTTVADGAGWVGAVPVPEPSAGPLSLFGVMVLICVRGARRPAPWLLANRLSGSVRT